MTSVTSQRSAEILTQWIKGIQQREKREGEKKKAIERIREEIGNAIGVGHHTIESWQGRKRRPDAAQAILIAKEIVRRLPDIKQQDFLDFLSGFGHPSPLTVWQKLNPWRKVDVPAAEEHFVRDEKKIAELISVLKPGETVSLYGPGGVGKTALVIAATQHLASNPELAKQFPDGILYFNFYGGYTINDAYHYILLFFGIVIPEKRQDYREAVRDALRERQALLVLDGTEEVDNWGDLVRMQRDNGVLIVTRYFYATHGTRFPLESPPLTLAFDILQAWSSDATGQSTFQAWRSDQSADIKVIEEICERLGRLPLALRLAGRYMLYCTTTAYQFLELLEEWGLSLLHESEHQHDQSVMILMEKSIEQVCQETGAEDARNILAVVGLLAYAPFDIDIIINARETPLLSIRTAIGTLNKFSMLKWISNQRYQLIHRLIHTYARKHLTLAGKAGVLIRLADYYANLVAVQSQLGLDGYARLEAERPHFMSVLESCVDQKEWVRVNKLVAAIGEYLHLHGYGVDSITVYESGLKSAQILQDRQSEDAFLGNLGKIYADLGEMETAINYYQQALSISREIGDRDGEGDHLGNLGKAYHILGQRETAIDYYQQALTISRELGDRHGESNQFGNLGILYAQVGQVKTAMDCYQQALAIDREIGDRRNEGSHLGYLGMAYSALGHYQPSIEYHQQALAISREVGDRRSEGNHLGNLGNVCADLGQMETAISYYQQALAVAREIGNRRGEANQLGNLGTVHIELGQVEIAIDYHQQALAISRETGDREAEGIWLGEMGNGYHRLKQMETAIDYYQKALAVVREIGDHDGEGIWLGNLGRVFANLGQIETAIDYHQQSLAIAREIGNRRSESNQLGNLGEVYFKLEQIEMAIEYYQQALTISREIGARYGEGIHLANLGEAYANLKEVQIARQYWEQSLHILVEIKSPHAEQVRSWLKSLEDK